MLNSFVNCIDYFFLIPAPKDSEEGPSENEDNPLLVIDSSTSTLFLAVLAVLMIFVSGFIP